MLIFIKRKTVNNRIKQKTERMSGDTKGSAMVGPVLIISYHIYTALWFMTRTESTEIIVPSIRIPLYGTAVSRGALAV